MKVCALSVLCAVVGAVIGGISGSMSRVIKLAGLALVLGAGMGILGEVITSVVHISTGFDADEYFSVLLKGLAIATLCRVCCDVCHDCGETTVASAVESAGKLSLVLLALPLVSKLCDVAKELLQNV